MQMTVLHRLSKKMESIPSDLRRAFNPARLLLEPLGIWPQKFSNQSKLSRLILQIICILTLILLLFPCMFHIFFIEKSFVKRLRCFGPFGYFIMNSYKYVVLLSQNRKFANCIERVASECQNTKIPEERNVLLEHANKARKLIMIGVVITYGSVVSYVGIWPVLKDPAIIGNQTYKFLAFPAFYFIDVQATPYYQLAYSFHLGSSIVTCGIICGVFSIAILGVLHVCGQCAIVCEQLKSLPITGADRKSIHSVVSRHVNALKFAAYLEKVFREILFVETLGSTAITVLLGHYIITESAQGEYSGPITYAGLITNYIFNIYAMCYIGHLLTEECEKIGTRAYMTDWHNISAKEGKSLIMIMAITQRPVNLTAGKMTNMVFQTFASVIKACLTYLNMLRKVTTRDF